MIKYPPLRTHPFCGWGGEGHNTPLPQIHSVEDWRHIIHTHSHEGFSQIPHQYKDTTCLPCVDVSGVALLRPSLIYHYVSGGWQGTLETPECLDGIFKLLCLDPSISRIQPLEAAQLLVIGEAPSRLARSRHFPEGDSS